MTNFVVKPIGKVLNNEGRYRIVLEEEYFDGLKEIDNFTYLNILWWFDKIEESSRNNLIEDSPYVGSPDTLGVFATRSEQRPNPIALTTSYLLDVDYEKGIIELAFIDADDGTPVLDIKPYTPAFDRVESLDIPKWCQTWPMSLEESAYFDWSKVFKF